MDAIQFLKQEHQTAKAEFEKVLQASPKARGGLWQKLSPELEAHEQIEDAVVTERFAQSRPRADRAVHRNERNFGRAVRILWHRLQFFIRLQFLACLGADGAGD